MYETQMSLWGAILGGANLVYHAAGWLEGGLTASYEKLVLDVEMLQHMMEFLRPDEVTEESLNSTRSPVCRPADIFLAILIPTGTLGRRLLQPVACPIQHSTKIGWTPAARIEPSARPRREAGPAQHRRASDGPRRSARNSTPI